MICKQYQAFRVRDDLNGKIKDIEFGLKFFEWYIKIIFYLFDVIDFVLEKMSNLNKITHYPKTHEVFGNGRVNLLLLSFYLFNIINWI